MPAFARYIGIDYSGAQTPTASLKGLRVYPRLWNRTFASEGLTGDQHDANSIAAWLSRTDRDGNLGEFLKPVLTPPERTVAEVEGWILGVAWRP